MMTGRRGFTLIELLVVIGIIAAITAASVVGYSSFTRHAQQIRGQEMIHQVQTAMVALMQTNDAWPRILLAAAQNGDGRLDEKVAVALKDALSLTYDKTANRLYGHDRFGILTPWGADFLKRASDKASLNSHLPTGGTVFDHILHFAIDDDFDGVTVLSGDLSLQGVRVRAPACVWCCGRDGKLGTKDDIRSWSKGMEEDK